MTPSFAAFAVKKASPSGVEARETAASAARVRNEKTAFIVVGGDGRNKQREAQGTQGGFFSLFSFACRS
jgi:hypothetical protein